jgi:hypothetical protein
MLRSLLPAVQAATAVTIPMEDIVPELPVATPVTQSTGVMGDLPVAMVTLLAMTLPIMVTRLRMVEIRVIHLQVLVMTTRKFPRPIYGLLHEDLVEDTQPSDYPSIDLY